VWGKYGAMLVLLVMQRTIWEPRMHYVVVTKDNFIVILVQSGLHS